MRSWCTPTQADLYAQTILAQNPGLKDQPGLWRGPGLREHEQQHLNLSDEHQDRNTRVKQFRSSVQSSWYWSSNRTAPESPVSRLSNRSCGPRSSQVRHPVPNERKSNTIAELERLSDDGGRGATGTPTVGNHVGTARLVTKSGANYTPRRHLPRHLRAHNLVHPLEQEMRTASVTVGD
jgi:hypothetical protein